MDRSSQTQIVLSILVYRCWYLCVDVDALLYLADYLLAEIRL